MKKKLSIIIDVALICAIFFAICAIIKMKEEKALHNKTVQSIQNQINANEAQMNLIDSNKCIADMLCQEDIKKATEYGNEAINLMNEAEEKIKNVISSPNFLEDGIKELQENYKKTVEIIKTLPNISEKDANQAYKLLDDGTYIHLDLLRCLQSFCSLYEIREFDSLPDEEAENFLKESWELFGFDPSIKCPEEFDEKELYVIWAKQYAKTDEVSQSIIDKIEKLRKNDDLTSKKYNKKWLDLIREICSTDALEWFNSSALFLYVKSL